MVDERAALRVGRTLFGPLPGVACALSAPMQFCRYAQREVVQRQSGNSLPLKRIGKAVFRFNFVLELPVTAAASNENLLWIASGLLARARTAAAVKRFSAERGCTTFTTLLAAFNVLLHG